MAKGCRHDLGALIDRQIERCTRSAAEQEPAAAPVVAEDPTLPYVAISRAAAIDALPLARAIAARTGYRLVDEELVDAIAISAGVPRAVAQTYDLNPHAELEQMIADLPFMHMFSEDEYVRHLARVVRETAAKNRTVLVGHAAGMILSPSRGVRMYLTAPLEVRARQAALTKGDTMDSARERVREEDHRRQLFCERHFGFRPDSLHAADLVFDVAVHGEAWICDQVGQALGERVALLSAKRAAQSDLSRVQAPGTYRLTRLTL